MKTGRLLKMLQDFLFVFVIVALMHADKVQTKKCKLKKNALGSYYLQCDEKFDERSTPRKEKNNRKPKRGPPGPQGPVGPAGKDGARGIQGPEGPMGPIGPTGVPGPRGHKGKTGPKGDRGDQGPMGAQGKPGLPGNCIRENPKALNKKYHCLPGPEGPQGSKGHQGERGLPGLQGERGSKGEPGVKGDRGRRGPVGMPGLPGQAGTVTCENHYTEWISRYADINGNTVHGFLCPAGNFLQGFKQERKDMKERYLYICCYFA